jgi:hypothetical protein
MREKRQRGDDMSETDQAKARARQSICRIAVAGYKSIAEEQSIEVVPLTVLAGANSSGKSSMLQPLLLLKQTMEASYDPGPLLLDGPHVRFNKAEQLLSPGASDFSVRLQTDVGGGITNHYAKKFEGGFELRTMDFLRASDGSSGTLQRDSSSETVRGALPVPLKRLLSPDFEPEGLDVGRKRCFLAIRAISNKSQFAFLLAQTRGTPEAPLPPVVPLPLDALEPAAPLLPVITGLIHVPGLRGNPARSYPRAEIGESFDGAFEPYVASLIQHWADTDEDKLARLIQCLRHVGIARYLKSQRIDDTRVELQVARLPAGEMFGSTDLVNIVDVGFGISQALPVLTALIAAKRGQLVYIEQPELHLHPLAQSRMADILVGAARRGVRVVVETHSDLLLRGIQTSVAKCQIAPAAVSLNWFTRDMKTGLTTVTKAELDEDGAFGEWPADFDQVALGAERAYLDAVEARRCK